MSLLVSRELFMSDKNKKEQTQDTHIFEVHTMKGDHWVKEKSMTPPSKKQAKSKTTPTIKKQVSPQKNEKIKKPVKPIKSTKPIKKQESVNSENPFLSIEDHNAQKKSTKKGSFAPGRHSEPVEKINSNPSDIAPKPKPKSKTLPPKKKSKSMHIIVIVLIVIFLLAAVGFGIFMLKFNNQVTDYPVDDVLINKPIDIPTEDDVIDIEETLKDDVEDESIKQMYSTDLPNYFSIDVESVTSEDDIKSELDTIAKNMQEQDIEGPVSFIVTDANNNPVSFHVFAMSANMDMAQDIITSLEEGFEIYAYNDGIGGVRFGFVIDAKDVDLLKTALISSETTLPKSFDFILNDLGALATDIAFQDNIYDTYSIRYYNLDEEKTYSVDYIVANEKFLIGTSKNTIREMVDYLKDAETPEDSEAEFQY